MASRYNKLTSRWVMWYHAVKNNNWDQDSYGLLGIQENNKDLSIIRKILLNLNIEIINNSMIFLMRERITKNDRRFVYPTWEDNYNADGGTICFLGSNYSIINNLFWTLLAYIASDQLYQDPVLCIQHINGISFSPKLHESKWTVKIWCSVIPVEIKEEQTVAEHALSCVTELWNNHVVKIVEGLDSYFVPFKIVKERDKNNTKKKNEKYKKYKKMNWKKKNISRRQFETS
jgi:hypothetical protein